jgi:hypothetical protein
MAGEPPANLTLGFERAHVSCHFRHTVLPSSPLRRPIAKRAGDAEAHTVTVGRADGRLETRQIVRHTLAFRLGPRARSIDPAAFKVSPMDAPHLVRG